MTPSKFGSKLFRRGFTFAVALIQNEKINVERVAILMGHPVVCIMYLLREYVLTYSTSSPKVYAQHSPKFVSSCLVGMLFCSVYVEMLYCT